MSFRVLLRAKSVLPQTSNPITGDYDNQERTNSQIILPKTLYERKDIISDSLDVEKLISWHPSVRTAMLVETSPSSPVACLEDKQQLMPGEQRKRTAAVSQTPASCGSGTSLRQM